MLVSSFCQDIYMDTLWGGFFSVGNNENINLIRKFIIFTEYPCASMSTGRLPPVD